LAVAAGVFAWFWKRRRRHWAENLNDSVGDSQESTPSHWQGGGGQPVPEKDAPKFLVEPIGVETAQPPYWNRTGVRAELSSAHTPAEIATSQVIIRN
jgi:hypothetical protein